MADSKLRAAERHHATTGSPDSLARLNTLRARAGLPSLAEAKALADAAEVSRKQQRIYNLIDRLELWQNGDVDSYEGIAGETEEPTLAGDWNSVEDRALEVGPMPQEPEQRYHSNVRGYPRDWQGPVVLAPKQRYFVGQGTYDETMPRIEALAERSGINVVWRESYLRCDCGKGFNTDGDPYTGAIYGYVGDGDYACGDCLKDSDCEDCNMPTLQSEGHCHQRVGPDVTCHCDCEDSCDYDEEDEEEEPEPVASRRLTASWLGTPQWDLPNYGI